MSEHLENFLIDLSSNPDKLARFTQNPSDAVAQSSLNAEERAAVMSGDSESLADALGSNGFALGLGVEIITPSRAPAKRKAPSRRKTPAKRKAPAKKGPARKKTPARKQAPARKKAPAKRPAKRAPAKRAPAKRAPARRAPARKSARKTASRKKR